MLKLRLFILLGAFVLLPGCIIIPIPLPGAAITGTIQPATATAPSSRLNVTLTEYAITMPAIAHAGVVEFIVSNRGTKAHNFRVEGRNTSLQFGTDLVPGETKVMRVSLAPGVYRISCPVDAHALLGMDVRLSVQP